MLYKFKSKATADLVMLQPNAEELLKIIGKAAGPTGIITVAQANAAIAAIQALYDRGVAQGVFRPGLDATDIHASISALTFFNVSNQHTFGLIFKDAAQGEAALATRRANITEMVVRFLLR